MGCEIDISVIIATHNRSLILKETLRHMAGLDRSKLNVEFVVVDNNSSDATRSVVEEYSAGMPLRYLFEARAGQNSARNRGLSDAPLGRIVAFTDDDVLPCTNWFQDMASAARRWPDYDIFGGRIHPIWPSQDRPKWTDIRLVQELGYAYHEYSSKETPYRTGDFPSSGNMWMRRKVFEGGAKFDESMAWHPGNRIMATETMFLMNAARNGHLIMHCPKAIMGHRIEQSQISLSYILRRAYSWGRGMAHLRGICKERTYIRHPVWWYCMRYAAIGRQGLELAASMSTLAMGQPAWAMYALQWLGFNVEQLALAISPTRSR